MTVVMFCIPFYQSGTALVTFLDVNYSGNNKTY